MKTELQVATGIPKVKKKEGGGSFLQGLSRYARWAGGGIAEKGLEGGSFRACEHRRGAIGYPPGVTGARGEGGVVSGYGVVAGGGGLPQSERGVRRGGREHKDPCTRGNQKRNPGEVLRKREQGDYHATKGWGV